MSHKLAACAAKYLLRRAWGTFERSAILTLTIIAGVTNPGVQCQSPAERTFQVQDSPEWRQGHFQNPQPTWSNIPKAVFHQVFGAKVPETTPSHPIAVLYSHGEALSSPPPSGLRVTWFGHSSALVEVDGSKLLIDPFWGERASPFSWLGPKRWYAPPIPLQNLPEIDAVLISHDHYDHLDFSTIAAMRSWRTIFIVPLGVGKQLQRWGIPQSRITELDWWQSTQLGRVKLVATPARHQSGRSLLRLRKTLWAGWAILGDQHRVWYSGDTGYSRDFFAIGERLGPFDVTLIEVGQYGKYWPDFHLGPEQAVEVNRNVGGQTMIPVHWGLIKLSNHGWTEPVERVLVAAHCRHVDVEIPRPGESVEPTLHPHIPVWWPKLPWKSASVNPIEATENGSSSHRVLLSPCSP
jgi:L-ascorbate metabolism protein UlaG (beta-lactamase superfamily)